MNRLQHRFIVSRRHMAGLSLIEMMIALVMALIVAAGIISVFTSTSSSNKVQSQMAALQEEGRFAIQNLRTDLANANGGYCSNSGGNAGTTGSGLYLDALRSPTIYSEVNLAPATATTTFFPDNTVALADPTGDYSLPSAIFMRGYDCTASACTPTGLASLVPAIPAMGAVVNDRVRGADVLSIRYLKPGSGWTISPNGGTPGSVIAAGSDGIVTQITLNPLPGEASKSEFKNGDLAMLADCSNAQVFKAAFDGTNITPDASAGANYALPNDVSKGAAPRVFDFNADFQTITYYVKVVCANGTSPCTGTTTGELERRVNGVDQPLVRGVERLDFRYGIINAAGGVQFLTAEEVDSGSAGGTPIACPPDVPIDGGMGDAGCLWRAVQTIQVNILMDGQTPLYTLAPAEMNYIYTPDGANTPTPPSGHGITPTAQGFPNQLLRREFTTVVALRNFNP